MNTSHLILPVILCFVIKVFPQSDAYTYGNAPLEQLTMTQYEKDTTANAVVLYEQGYAVIEKDQIGNIKLIYTYKARVKLFKKEAFHHATYHIPLVKSPTSQNKERLLYAKAIALNRHEAPVALKKSDIYVENRNETVDIVKFTVPNVIEGTVFDVEYQTSSPFLFNFQEWKFQSDIPKVYSEYHTVIPANYQYNVKLVGFLKLDNRTSSLKKDCLTVPRGGSADCTLDTYVMKHIPAFIAEEYMTSEKNYISRIAFELKEFQDFRGIKDKYTKSWKDVDKELKHGEDIGKQARKENNFRKHIAQEIVAMPNTIDKAKALYSDLQKRMTWNKKNYIFRNVDVKKAFEERVGSVAELNLILLNMLKAAGFDAHFMLLSTRQNGYATKLYPVISEFNYLIVKLDYEGTTYLLDITDKSLPFGTLPFKALNGYGRVMDFKNGSYWYIIKADKNTLHTNYIQYNIAADGKITANMSDGNLGYFAIHKRSEILNTSEEDYLETIENKLSKVSEAEITSYKVFGKNNIDKTLRETFTVNFREQLTGNFIYLYPFIYNKYKENPFKLNVRNYPVNFGHPFGYNHQIVIKVDPTYEITELPDSKTISIGENHASLSLKSHINNNEITIALTFVIHKSIFFPDEYHDLKNLFSELVTIQNNLPVILKKKEKD